MLHDATRFLKYWLKAVGVVRILPAAAVLLLLAGCASPTAPDGLPADTDMDGTAPAVHILHGNLTGAGVVSPMEVSFYGISSRSQSFQVREGATRLTAVLAWDAPADLYLDLHDPERQVVQSNAFTGPLERTVRFETTEVLAGQWSAMAWAQGPAVTAYTITITVDHS